MKSGTIIARMLALIVCGLMATDSVGQSKYWIFFTDKAPADLTRSWVSARTLANRRLLGLPQWQYTDVGVNQAYVSAISSLDVRVANRSKWLNGISAFLEPAQVAIVQKLPFVKNIRRMTSRTIIAGGDDAMPTLDTLALHQINAQALRRQGLTGTNVLIGVIDGRFAHADASPELQHVFATNRVKYVKDFIQNDPKQVYQEEALIDWHGTVVWQRIAGVDPVKQVAYGLAPKADFCLARVDDKKVENRAEEDHWVSAVEWMDSLGARLVNSSLGYSLDHDNPSEDYKREEMNGQTSSVAKAAQIAALQKGMVVVVAAGNEGANKDWRIVVTPGDAKDVITVGAALENIWLKPLYSAIGPDFLPYVKPNVTCFTPLGTSLAAPIITGLIACMLEKKPNLTSQEARELIEKAGHLYPYGNNYLGYGVPDAAKLIKLLDDPAYVFNTAETIRYKVDRLDEFKQEDKKVVLKGAKYTATPVVLHHKSDNKTVVYQFVRSPKRKKITIERPDNVTATTVASKTGVLEIKW